MRQTSEGARPAPEEANTFGPEQIQAMLPHVPRLLTEWTLDAGEVRWQRVDASLVFVDVSGFTALSEKLAQQGRIGAEQLTDILGGSFEMMLNLAYARGGALLKFGGDALLLMFDGDHRVERACAAAVEMRTALRDFCEQPRHGSRVRLRMSVGVHDGPADFFRAGTSHNELLIAGPTATRITDIEESARPGQILVSQSVAAALPEGATRSVGDLFELRWRKPRAPESDVILRRDVPDDEIVYGVPRALRQVLSDDIMEAEHRNATVGFIKIAGIDDVMDEVTAEDAAGRIHSVISAIQEECDREEVTFLGTDVSDNGVKVIIAAGVPATQEDDEGRVLRAARQILDRDLPLALHIGVNRGHVFAGEVGTTYRQTYTVMGDTVNLAARLAAKAATGELIASPAVLDRSRTLFEATALDPFRAKGKSQLVQAYLLGAETGARSRRDGDRLPFGGREEELARVRSMLKGDFPSRVLTVEGPAGIGKSRLIREATATADHSRVLSIRGEAYGASSPYRALRDLARGLLGIRRAAPAVMAERLEHMFLQVLPDVAQLTALYADVAHLSVVESAEVADIEPRFRPDRTADVFIEVLRRTVSTGLVLVVEDAHWLDDRSAALIARVARAVEENEWRVIITRRPAEGGPLLDSGETINLGPLSQDETRHVASAATAAAPLHPNALDQVVVRSAGNPLFLDELLSAVRVSGSTDDLPDSLDALVGAELDGLEPLPRRFLRYASVLGLSFRGELLRQVLAGEPAELDAAAMSTLSRFLEPDGSDRWRFRHALVRDVAYAGLTFQRRRDLHRKAAEAIEARAQPEPDTEADALSRHYAAAGAVDKAWYYACVAGRRALDTFANLEAAVHFERALELGRRKADIAAAERASVLVSLGDALHQAGHFDKALDAYRKASRQTNDPVAMADLYVKRARARVPIGDFGTALAETMRGLASLQDIDSPAAAAARARLRSFRAGIRMNQQQPREALDLALAAAGEASRAGEEQALARAYVIMDWAHRALGETAMSVASQRALDICERIGDLSQAANIRNNLGGYAYFDGDWEEAIAHYDAAREAYRRTGDLIGAAVAASNMGELLVSRGDAAAARPLIDNALQALRGSGVVDDTFFADIQLGRLLLVEGQTAAGLDHLAELQALAVDLDQPWSVLEIALYRAEALLDSADASAAQDLVEGAMSEAADYADFFAASIAHCRARVMLADGDLRGAAEQADLGLEQAERLGLRYERLKLLRLRNECVRRSGELPDPADEALVSELAGELGILSFG